MVRALDRKLLSAVVLGGNAEIHFDIPEMHKDFGTNLKMKLPEVIEELHAFRSRGLRIHYWP